MSSAFDLARLEATTRENLRLLAEEPAYSTLIESGMSRAEIGRAAASKLFPDRPHQMTAREAVLKDANGVVGATRKRLTAWPVPTGQLIPYSETKELWIQKQQTKHAAELEFLDDAIGRVRQHRDDVEALVLLGEVDVAKQAYDEGPPLTPDEESRLFNLLATTSPHLFFPSTTEEDG